MGVGTTVVGRVVGDGEQAGRQQGLRDWGRNEQLRGGLERDGVMGNRVRGLRGGKLGTGGKGNRDTGREKEKDGKLRVCGGGKAGLWGERRGAGGFFFFFYFYFHIIFLFIIFMVFMPREFFFI
jgi:hypothetical protein